MVTKKDEKEATRENTWWDILSPVCFHANKFLWKKEKKKKKSVWRVTWMGRNLL